jgi:DNA-binding NarL/FixJ family response regulator
MIFRPAPGCWKGELPMFSVLVVENNEFFRKSFAGMLKQHMPSLVIEDTGDGYDAIERIDAKVPDIIFLDIRLPGKSGLELTKEIKTRYPETKIGIFSNHDLPEYRTSVSKCGADYFLDKSSLCCTEIFALIEGLLIGKRSGA